MTVLKAAIYCRLSEEDRNKHSHWEVSGSIQNQQTMLTEYAAEHGWEVVQIYSDEDYAGADRNRPAFRQLLRDAENGQFDIILCKTQSRFTRELELVEKYIHGLFPVWGIRFVSVVDNADTASKGNKKSRQINGLVNEWYLEDLSDNIRSVLISRRKNGFHIGSFALYGYRKDPAQKGRLLVDEEAARVVRTVFELFASGMGKTAIARLLNQRNIPNPTEYKRLQGLRYQQPKSEKSTLWRYATIANMLVNPMYIGHMVQGRYGSVSYKTKQNRPRPRQDWYVVENTHEPIICRELWDRVQRLVDQRTRPFATGQIGLFAGKVVCAGCGYGMRTTVSRGVRYLKCATRHVAKDACEGAFIRTEYLEKLVLEELERLSAVYLNLDELERKMVPDNSGQEMKKRLEDEQSLYQKRMGEYTMAIRQLYMDRARGMISQSDYADMMQAFQAERQQLENRSEEIARQIVRWNTQTQEMSKRMRIAQYVNPDQLSRAFVEGMIDHIAVGKRIAGTRHVPVEIHWNF